MSSCNLRVYVCPVDFGVLVQCLIPGEGYGKVATAYAFSEAEIKDAQKEVLKIARKEIERELP